MKKKIEKKDKYKQMILLKQERQYRVQPLPLGSVRGVLGFWLMGELGGAWVGAWVGA